MKILLINGSPHPNGVCAFALEQARQVLEEEGLETQTIFLGNKDIRGCIACNYCKTHGKCVFNDIVNETAGIFEEASGMICASPTYYANANGTLMNYMQRLFYSTPFDKSMKAGAAIASARRAGTLCTFDEINKYYTIAQMPVVSSCYWNDIFGNNADEARQDAEGVKIMRQLARNMAFLCKSIELGRNQFGLPVKEPAASTNFIRAASGKD